MSGEYTPITLDEFKEAVKDIPDDVLVSLRDQFGTSLAKLTETNAYLENEIAGGAEADDRKLYEETIAENEAVIKGQKAKLSCLETELKSRGLDSDPGVYL